VVVSVVSDVFDALEQEHAAIDAMLGPLDEASWARPSLCAGWTVADVVLHLAQSEEMVAASPRSEPQAARWPEGGGSTIDEVVEDWVSAQRGAAPRKVLERWRAATRAAVRALREAGPDDRFPWATVPLKARTLATTRLAEHWIHANDIAKPLGVAYPDTERLWHIARLAHRTVPYAFARAGRDDPPSVRVELSAPGEAEWVFGDEDASCVIRGSASEFCRIAGRRLVPGDAVTITTAGGRANEVLDLVRTYA
jgi:uncharacterized protein (TIGR03084 family)